MEEKLQEKLEKDTHAAEILDKIGFFDVESGQSNDSMEDNG